MTSPSADERTAWRNAFGAINRGYAAIIIRLLDEVERLEAKLDYWQTVNRISCDERSAAVVQRDELRERNAKLVEALRTYWGVMSASSPERGWTTEPTLLWHSEREAAVRLVRAALALVADDQEGETVSRGPDL